MTAVADQEITAIVARAAEEWFEDNDPLGVAFEYEVLE